MKNLLAKYGTLSPLTSDETEVIENLSSVKVTCEAGKDLVAGDFDEPDQLFIVEEGRLFASLELPSGDRAITRLYYAGDIVGTANVPFEHATQTITVNAPSTIYVFPRRHLIEAFTDMPRIAAIFYTFAALESAILNDRLVSVGRTRGKSRLASLILEIEARHSLAVPDPGKAFDIGLTQTQIGEAIGLTSIQVNRLFRALDEDGLISRDKSEIEILDRDRLTEIGQFRNRYEDLDLDWFDEHF
ncbi:Crp/Fnr family transcriptional regulator [Altererythrobacter sp. MF3-039]|uniref:Crp/Fnr family transcriptional regulator n=1 Tax=Altererythrobacter sp. MF3-039 TaxID=3252901 RepID=UPI00390C995C